MHTTISSDSKDILEAAKYLSIVMIVIQLLFSGTLQAFQVSKVKGAIRIYLLLDFLSVLAVNTGLFFKIKNTRENFDKMKTLFNLKNVTNDITFGAEVSSVFIINDVNQIFVDLRKVFLVLIINDAYIMLCEPFLFKEYLEAKNMIKKYLAALGFWSAFHVLHLVNAVTNLIYLVTENYFVEAFYIWSRFSLALKWSKNGLVLVYTLVLLSGGCMRCLYMRATLREMDQNEFARNIYQIKAT